jgi:hypothetical protein
MDAVKEQIGKVGLLEIKVGPMRATLRYSKKEKDTWGYRKKGNNEIISKINPEDMAIFAINLMKKDKRYQPGMKTGVRYTSFINSNSYSTNSN